VIDRRQFFRRVGGLAVSITLQPFPLPEFKVFESQPGDYKLEGERMVFLVDLKYPGP